MCYAISEIEMHTHLWYVLRLYVRLKCLLWENPTIMHQVYESRFALQPCHVCFKYVSIIENIFNDLLWWLWLFMLYCFGVGILLSYLTHSVLFIFLQVIMLKLFSFCLQVLDVVDFVAAQEEIFWSTSCRVFCSFLYSTSTMIMTCIL